MMRQLGTPAARAAVTKSRVAQGEVLRPGQAAEADPQGNADEQRQLPDADTEDGDEQEGREDSRHHGEELEQAQREPVEKSPEPPGQNAEGHSDGEAYRRRPDRNSHRGPIAPDRPGQGVTAQLVSPEQVARAGAGKRGGQVDGGVPIGGDERGQDPHQQDHRGYTASDERKAVLAVAVPGGVPEAAAGSASRNGGAGGQGYRGHRDMPSSRTLGSTST